MPDYKRKKVKRGLKPKRKEIVVSDNIPMTDSKRHKKENVVPENNIKVIRGAKLKRKRRITFLLAITSVILVTCIILSLVLPVSLYENIVNTFALIGSGSYPKEINGNLTLNTISNGSYYYVLTDTNITAYSNSGKQVFTDMHGFANPALSISETRALVFDQGGKNLYIYNLSGRIDSIETENDIINASISRSGAVAVSIHSNKYTSVVKVYDKNSELMYTWNSAKDIANNVMVNPEGDRVAISTMNATSGQYNSKVMILGFNSADPLHTAELGNSIVLSLANTDDGISVITNNKYKYIHWSEFTTNDITTSGEVNIFRRSSEGILLVFNRANDRSDNTVVLISEDGEKINEFKIKNTITDIQYSDNKVYYISDTIAEILNEKGSVLRKGSCAFGTTFFAVLSSDSLAVINDNKILKINIEKGE